VPPKPKPKADSAVANALAGNRLNTRHIMFAMASAVAPLTVAAGVFPSSIGISGLLGIPIAIAAMGLLVLLWSEGYLAMGRRILNAGAIYAYAAQGLGRPIGVGVAWVALAGYTAFQVASYGGFGYIAAALLHEWTGWEVHWFGQRDVSWVVLALAAWLLVAVLGVLDVGVPAQVMLRLAVAEMILVVAYDVAIVLAPGFHLSTAPLSLGNLWGPGAGALIVVAMTAYAGGEQGAGFIEESHDPQRTVPRATRGIIIAVGALFFASSWIQISAGGPQVAARAAEEGPDLFFNEAASVLGPAALHIGHVLFLTSMLAAAIAFHQAFCRYGFALGRERVLPQSFGRTSSKGAPRNASLVQSALGLATILVWLVMGWKPLEQLFFWGGTSGGLAVLLLFTVASLSVIGYFLRRRRAHAAAKKNDPSTGPETDPEHWWRAYLAPSIAAIVLAVVSVVAIDSLPLLYGVNPGTGPALVVPLAFAVIFAAGAVWALILRWHQPLVYQGIGLGTGSQAAGPGGLAQTPGVHSARTGAHR